MSEAAEIPEALTKEVGAGKYKMPVWMWGVAVVVGVLIARKVKSAGLFGGAAPDASTSDGTDPSSLDALGTATLGLGGAVNVGDGTAGGSFDAGTAGTLTDNDAWRKAADNYLTSAGYDSLAAARAIDAYLGGDPLTPAQAIMVEAALRRLGATPETVPPPLSVPPPIVPSPPVKPPTKPKPKPTPVPNRAVPVQQAKALHGPPKAPANKAEHFVDYCNAQSGKGTWWLTNLGGVYTSGTATFYGSPIGAGEHRSDWQRLDTRFPHAGYTAVAGGGHTRSFG